MEIGSEMIRLFYASSFDENGLEMEFYFLTHEYCVVAFVSLCDHSHIPIALTFRVNEAALRVVLKPDRKHVIERTSNNASSTLPFIHISNRFSRCLDHCFRPFPSLFESISID